MTLQQLADQLRLSRLLLDALKKDNMEEWYIWAAQRNVKEYERAYRKALELREEYTHDIHY
jgi:hypothetical protein